MGPFFDILFDFLYPRRCLSCGKFGNYICDHCTSIIQIIEVNICPVCQKPAIDGKTHPKCQTRYSLDGLTSIFRYQGVIREAIKKIKYKPFAFDISETLVSLALEKIDKKSLFYRIIKEKPTLVSIPLHRSRERVRGFNQSEILGKILAKELGLPFVKDLLLRKKPTQPQYGLKKKERQKNVRGVFKINPDYNSYKFHNRYILFDDIWTTGATMRTCANALKRAGAGFVWGLTIAR